MCSHASVRLNRGGYHQLLFPVSLCMLASLIHTAFCHRAGMQAISSSNLYLLPLLLCWDWKSVSINWKALNSTVNWLNLDEESGKSAQNTVGKSMVTKYQNSMFSIGVGLFYQKSGAANLGRLNVRCLFIFLMKDNGQTFEKSFWGHL